MIEKIKNIREGRILGFNYSQFFSMVAMALYIIWLSQATAPVKNYDNETNTILYTEEDLMSPEPIFPKNYVNSTYVFFGFVIIGWIFISFSANETLGTALDIIGARKIVEKYLTDVKQIIMHDGTIIDIGTFVISEKFLPQYVYEKEGKRLDKFILMVHITDTSGIPFLLKAYVDIALRQITAFVEIEEQLSTTDKCDKCGKEPDLLIINTEDLKKYKKIKDGDKD